MLVSISISIMGESGLWILLMLTACFGVIFTIYPVAMAQAQDNIETENIVPVSAALILFFGLGACLGPVTASSIIMITGPWGLYHFTAACGGLLGGAAWFWRNKLSGKVEDQVPFIPVPKTSPMVSTLDPRGDYDGFTEENNINE